MREGNNATHLVMQFLFAMTNAVIASMLSRMNMLCSCTCLTHALHADVYKHKKSTVLLVKPALTHTTLHACLVYQPRTAHQ